jgi:NAD(P)H-dependent flavin oxidoreductase YrpB (nitropropane dioxygenase family)
MECEKMRTAIAEKLGCDVPIFAFSHCRDVVVEVTRAGGFGVLGASTFTPELLEQELRWIDEHVGGRPYGVDVLIPTTYDREAEQAGASGDTDRLIPATHLEFMESILSEAGVQKLPEDERARVHREIVDGRGNMTPDGARRLLEVTLRHPGINLVVSALGAPPADVVADLRGRGIMIGALCGKASHALRQRAAGVGLIIAQGTEAGGHTGDISTLVLVPQVVEACPDIPVLAAGGITRGSQIAAALALGAQGVWTGTIWLGTRESELTPFEKGVLFETRAEDTVRSRVRTGKPVRMVRSRMSDAWEKPGAPRYLPTPLQGILYNEIHARIVRSQRRDLYSFPVGQSVCSVNEETSVREVMLRMQTEYLDAMERLSRFGAEA